MLHRTFRILFYHRRAGGDIIANAFDFPAKSTAFSGAMGGADFRRRDCFVARRRRGIGATSAANRAIFFRPSRAAGRASFFRSRRVFPPRRRGAKALRNRPRRRRRFRLSRRRQRLAVARVGARSADFAHRPARRQTRWRGDVAHSRAPRFVGRGDSATNQLVDADLACRQKSHARLLARFFHSPARQRHGDLVFRQTAGGAQRPAAGRGGRLSRRAARARIAAVAARARGFRAWEGVVVFVRAFARFDSQHERAHAVFVRNAHRVGRRYPPQPRRAQCRLRDAAPRVSLVRAGRGRATIRCASFSD